MAWLQYWASDSSGAFNPLVQTQPEAKSKNESDVSRGKMQEVGASLNIVLWEWVSWGRLQKG